MRVLIVDDDAALRHSLTLLLGDAGHDVGFAEADGAIVFVKRTLARPNHAPHLTRTFDLRMLRNDVECVALHLQVNRPRDRVERLAHTGGAHGKQDARAVVLQDHRQVGREPLRFGKHFR